MCRPRLVPAACLAPGCPDPPGERTPGVSYFGCPPASRASCPRRSPRGRTSDLGTPREPRVYRCTGSAAGKRGQRSTLSFCLSAYCTRLVPSARAPAFGSVDPVCPGLTAPGALPLAQRLRLPPGPTTVVAPLSHKREGIFSQEPRFTAARVGRSLAPAPTTRAIRGGHQLYLEIAQNEEGYCLHSAAGCILLGR